MPSYTTLAELRGLAPPLTEERRRIVKAAQERSPAGSTFLSHSTKDEDYVSGALFILSQHGAAVYIDKKDDALPPTTSRDTAKILRTRIQECRKFVLLATKNSKDSRWMPWELGVADGFKRSPNIAIFPGVETASDTKWSEQEYLGIYDRVVWGNLQGEPKEVWMVWNQEKNTATKLSEWLRA